MVEVRFYGISRIKLGRKEMNIDAESVKELQSKIAEELALPIKDVSNFLVFVNEVNIDKLKGFKTKLHDGDTVMFLSPSSGG